LVKKSLHNEIHFNEIVERISHLTEDSQRKWGSMNVSQMLCHCHLVLQIPLQKIKIPEINPFFKAIGILTKKEIQLFNNGIPRNMPTFQKLIVNFECNFEEGRKNLLNTLNEYREVYQKDNLPANHQLFGEMKAKDWGFLEYKHLHHHLKQFNV